MSADLQLASDRVEDVTAALDVDDDLAEHAYDLAERADLMHPMNRSPDVVAASAVYFAGKHTTTRITQEAVAEAADVSKGAIGEAWRELAWHEDSDFVDHPPGDGRDESVEPEEVHEQPSPPRQPQTGRRFGAIQAAVWTVVLLLALVVTLAITPQTILDTVTEAVWRAVRSVPGSVAIVAPAHNHPQTKTQTQPHANE